MFKADREHSHPFAWFDIGGVTLVCYTLRMTKRKPLQFNWDPEKAEKNIEKYGVSFDEASAIFKDVHALYLDDLEHSHKEKREMVIGLSPARKRLLTCFITRVDGTVNLLGARISTHRERRAYDENSESEILFQIK